MSSTARLADVDRLEAALERRVLLDVLAVLVERGRADRAQLAAREHRLEHVARVDRALGRARADDRVQLVDEHDDLPLGVGDLLQHRLQPVLELAAVLRAGDHRADVERDQRRSRRPSGTSPSTIRWARPSTIAVLPTPGSPIRTGLFLVRRLRTWITRRISSSRPITGSSLPCGGRLGQVAAEALERLELVLGVLVGDAVEPRTSLERLEQLLARGADAAQRVAGLAGVRGDREHQVLGGDVLVLELAHLVLGGAQDLDQLAGAAGGLGAAGPLSFGSASSAAPSAWRTAAGSTPSLRSTGTTTPPSCSSSTASRCSGVVCGLRRSSASRWAAWIASWDLIVNRSGCMVSRSSWLGSEKSKSV